MTHDLRAQAARSASRIVVKVGSSVLAPKGKPLDRVFTSLAAQISGLVAGNRRIVLVSSGAVASGRHALRLPSGSLTLESKQAAAAVGQSLLMEAYRRAFKRHKRTVAQILLTHEDLSDRRRFLNARATLNTLIEKRCVPIVNENDTVATDEIRLGDNDNLAAQVATLVEADLLVLLTNTDGFHDRDPHLSPEARRLPVITHIDEETRRNAGESLDPFTVGGMHTKLDAARKAALSGAYTVVADGRDNRVLRRVLAGDDVGTLFVPSASALGSRKQWIAFSVKPKGRLVLDEGACKAVRDHHKSLLPSGIIRVEGQFERGDSVTLAGPEGSDIARGLSNYSSDELAKIRGVKSSAIESILGYKSADEVVHRDNLVML